MTPITIVLWLVIVMPGNTPDKIHKLDMPSLNECFTQAREWDDQGLTDRMKAAGGVAVSAGCWTNTPGSPKV